MLPIRKGLLMNAIARASLLGVLLLCGCIEYQSSSTATPTVTSSSGSVTSRPINPAEARGDAAEDAKVYKRSLRHP